MKWSSNLAYVIGLLVTDGNLSSDGRHINLTSKDLVQITNFAEILNLSNKIGIKKSGFAPGNSYYFLQFGDKKFYNFLLKIGLTPNKSKIIKDVYIPEKYFRDFLRGSLDGDGYTHSYWDKRWKKSFMLYTGFVSASIAHLEWIQDKLSNNYKIKGVIKPNGKNVFHLVYAKKASNILLRNIYYDPDLVCLPRKKFKIMESLSIIDTQAGVL